MKTKSKKGYILVFECNDKWLRSEDYPKVYSTKAAAQRVAQKGSKSNKLEYRVFEQVAK